MRLRDALWTLVHQINASAGRLPMGAVPDLRDLIDQLLAVLDHLGRNGADDLDPHTLHTLRATVDDYLPSSLDSYLALPDHVLASHRSADGRSAAEELSEQIALLVTGVEELSDAVYRGDAQNLATQRRFLDARFGRTDLDL